MWEYGHAFDQIHEPAFELPTRRDWPIPPRCYTRGAMYARKLTVEMKIGGERRAVPLEWLDSFCMRNFTGSAEFDDTLPTSEGQMEAGLRVEPARLATAMSEWFTKRGKGNGAAVLIEIRENRESDPAIQGPAEENIRE